MPDTEKPVVDEPTGDEATEKREQAPAEAPEAAPPKDDDEGPAGDEAAAEEAEDDAPDLAGLELELAAARAKLGEFKDKLLRAAADYDNYKRRAAKEREDAKQFGIESLLKDLLPVMDNLERGLEHARKAGDDETNPLFEGVTMVHKQFGDTLGRHGVEGFDSQGTEFDPNLHEAIHKIETDAVPPGHVAEEFQKGYLVNGRLARPALVIVAAAPVAPEQEPEPEEAPAEPEEAPAEPEEVPAEPEEAPAEPEEVPTESDEVVDEETPAPKPDEAPPGHTEMVLGAKVADASPELLEHRQLDGAALVVEVADLTPAARAGMQPGDVLTKAAGRPLTDARSFSRIVRSALPRHKFVTLTFLRGDGDEPQQTQLGARRR